MLDVHQLLLLLLLLLLYVRESESTPVRGGEDRQVGSGPAGDSETVLQHIVSLSQSVSAHAGATQL